MRYRVTLDYDGADFCGWQSQPSSPSVQETLEKALSTLLGGSVPVVGAGRTDTLVNAVGYVAHFDRDAVDCAQLRYKLNAILPDSVAVRSVEPVPDTFHARFDATRRTYRYFIHRTKDPFLRRTSYWYGYPELDFESMNRAAALLVGRHDFSCFEKTGSGNRTSVCTVYSAAWHPYEPVLRPLSCPGERLCWYFEISADRFLRNMVRAVTGTLLEVGRGKRTVGDFAALVLPAADSDAPDPRRFCRRSLAGESVPGHALFLVGVEY